MKFFLHLQHSNIEELSQDGKNWFAIFIWGEKWTVWLMPSHIASMAKISMKNDTVKLVISILVNWHISDYFFCRNVSIYIAMTAVEMWLFLGNFPQSFPQKFFAEKKCFINLLLKIIFIIQYKYHFFFRSDSFHFYYET